MHGRVITCSTHRCAVPPKAQFKHVSCKNSDYNYLPYYVPVPRGSVVRSFWGYKDKLSIGAAPIDMHSSLHRVAPDLPFLCV